jgi:hypothetical protein
VECRDKEDGCVGRGLCSVDASGPHSTSHSHGNSHPTRITPRTPTNSTLSANQPPRHDNPAMNAHIAPPIHLPAFALPSLSAPTALMPISLPRLTQCAADTRVRLTMLTRAKLSQ